MVVHNKLSIEERISSAVLCPLVQRDHLVGGSRRRRGKEASTRRPQIGRDLNLATALNNSPLSRPAKGLGTSNNSNNNHPFSGNSRSRDVTWTSLSIRPIQTLLQPLNLLLRPRQPRQPLRAFRLRPTPLLPQGLQTTRPCSSICNTIRNRWDSRNRKSNHSSSVIVLYCTCEICMECVNKSFCVSKVWSRHVKITYLRAPSPRKQKLVLCNY